MNCNAAVTITDGSGAGVSGVSVTIIFRSVLARTGWPYSVTGLVTDAAGGLSVRSNNIPVSSGQGCWFQVSSATKVDYVLNPAAVLTSATVMA